MTARVTALIAFLAPITAEALELRGFPAASQTVGYSSNVFVIEDRVERGRASSDFVFTSRAEATLIANLSPVWAARARYLYAFSEFFDQDNSNTNVHGGELLIGRALGRYFIVDAGVQGTVSRMHGFRPNDNDRVSALGRVRLRPRPGEEVELAYAHGERVFPRRHATIIDETVPLFVFGPVSVGGDTSIVEGDAQHDQEDSLALSLSRELTRRIRLTAGASWRHNDSNFANSRWTVAGGGLEIRVALPRKARLTAGARYARRAFASLEIEPGETRLDHIADAALALRVPVRSWLGVGLEGGTLVDRANGASGDFDATWVALTVTVNPPRPFVAGSAVHPVRRGRAERVLKDEPSRLEHEPAER